MNTARDNNSESQIATIAILIATILWGSTFIITKLGIQTFPPFLFQAIRHLIGFLLLIPLIKKYPKFTKIGFIAGLSMGIAVALLLICQTIALQTSDAGKGSFIYALYVPFTPFFAKFFLKSKILIKHWFSIGFSLLGLVILVFGQYGFDFILAPMVIGDFWMLIGAIIASFQIVLTEFFVKRVNIFEFVFFSLLTITLFLFGFSLFNQEYQITIEFSSSIWIAILYLGIFTTCLPGFIQAFAQQRISSTRAALVYSMEPVFATIFAVIFGNEFLDWMFFMGAFLILIGVLLSSVEIKNRNKEKKKMERLFRTN